MTHASPIRRLEGPPKAKGTGHALNARIAGYATVQQDRTACRVQEKRMTWLPVPLGGRSPVSDLVRTFITPPGESIH